MYLFIYLFIALFLSKNYTYQTLKKSDSKEYAALLENT